MEVDVVPFTELLSKIVDNRGRTCPTAETGLPLIATNCVRNDLLYPAFEKVRYVARDTYENWFRGHPEPGDLIFVCKGTPGRLCMTPDPVSFCIAQDMVAVRANPKKVYPKYLFALLRSQAVQKQIGNMHVGTLIPHFKKGDFDKLLLPIPDKETQEQIGNAYFELSAKIELNRRTSTTLEAMARALFQSWFLDFDPVRIKRDNPAGLSAEALAKAGLDPATAALFPSNFDEVELGLVPTGWLVRALGDVIDVKHGFAFPGDGFRNYPTNDILLTPGNFAVGGGFKEDRVKYFEGSVPQDYVLGQDDLVLTMTDLSKASDTLGYPAFIPAPPADRRYLHNQRLGKLIITKPEEVTPVFLYSLLCSDAYRNEILAGATGSTVKHTSPSRIKAFRTVFPPSAVLREFQDIVKPWYLRAGESWAECRTLTDIRDTLLSKLLSGRIDCILNP